MGDDIAMSILDELQLAVLQLIENNYPANTYDVEVVFEKFEQAHPGLVDLTDWEVHRSVYGSEVERISAWRVAPDE